MLQPKIWLGRWTYGVRFIDERSGCCEMNPIEQCWAQAKCYTQANCNYSLSVPQKIVPDALSVTSDDMQKHSRKKRHDMFTYLLGKIGGPDLGNK